MSDTYRFNEIPKQFNLTVYTHYCYHSAYSWQIGKVVHSITDLSGDEYICIAKTQVFVTVPETKVDIKQLVLDALEAEKKKQMAEHHKRMFELQEKIDSLLRLEYSPVSPPIDLECDNDLPF